MKDYSKLKGLIREKMGSYDILAKSLNKSTSLISMKLNGKVPFSIDEMDQIIDLLDIDTADIYDYFFRKKVENNSTN